MRSLSISNVIRVCLSAGTQERLTPVLRDVTGCWTITAEGTQSYRRSCRSRRRWRLAMSTLSARCWSRATRPRSETPMAGRCCTSLRRRAKSVACACSSNTEVKSLVALGQWGDGQVWFNVSLCKKISWMTSRDWHLFKLWLACWRWLLKESVLPKNVHYVTYPKVIRALYYYPYF